MTCIILLTLRREGLLDSGDYGTIDDLTYSYEGNQVVKIDDAADESPNYSGAMHFRDAVNEETEYTYDANGNMLTDSNKGITSIDYSVLDLPLCIKTKPRIIFKENTGNAIYTHIRLTGQNYAPHTWKPIQGQCHINQMPLIISRQAVS